MKRKPVVLRAQAEQDIRRALDHYIEDGGAQAGLAFVDVLEQAFLHLGRHPASGSTRYAHELDLPELRSWAVHRFPHIIFYVERDKAVDVWRVLHGQRNIPATLRPTD